MGKAIQKSSIPRTTLFLTTKLHPRHHGFNSTLKQMQTSFDRLHTDSLDLVLLHYPRQVTPDPLCLPHVEARDCTGSQI